MAGNGTIGLEIVEDLPEVEAAVVPYGGGELASAIAAGLRAATPEVKVFAAEVETAALPAASFSAGRPVTVEYVPSFVDGIGTPAVFPEMWELARHLLDGSMAVLLKSVIASIVCVVSGGNIDAGKLTAILRGETP
jgi:threonine dehydratase